MNYYQTISKNTHLDTERILPLLVKLAIPSVISGLASSSYYLIDIWFIGAYVGEEALAAVTVTQALQFVFWMQATFCAVGSGVLIAQNLGARYYHNVIRSLNIGIWSVFFLYVVITLPMLLFLDQILVLSGANQVTLSLAKEYIIPILLFGMLIPLNIVCAHALRNHGNANLSMWLSIIGAIGNVFFDWLFIVVFSLGLRGAALATVLVQVIVFIVSMIFVFKKFHIKCLFLHPSLIRKKLLCDAWKLGFPPGIKVGVLVLSTMIVTRQLSNYGFCVLAGYGIANKIIAVAFTVIQGFYFAIQPVIAFNYGAKNLTRLKNTLFIGLLLMFAIGGIQTLFFLLIPEWIFYRFTENFLVVQTAQDAVSWMGGTYFLFSVFMLLTGFVQAVGHPQEAFWLTLSRPVLKIALFMSLPLYLGIIGVWLVIPIVNVINTGLACWVTFSVYRRVVGCVE